MKTYRPKADDIFVLVGGHNLPYNNQVPSFQHIETNNNFRRVSEIIIHEKYESVNESTGSVNINYDFAILKLKASLIFSAKISPVCLSAFPSTKHAGRVGMVSGWGARNFEATEVSLVLKDLKVNVLSNQNCMEKIERYREELRQQPWVRGENLTVINNMHRRINIDRCENMYINKTFALFFTLQPPCLCVGKCNTRSSSWCSLFG